MSQAKQYPLWVSHSSMNDFLNCTRAYYLKQIYKDPRTGNKINIINPAMALGLTVHDVLDGLTHIKAEDRMNDPLLERFEKAWQEVTGELGGFRNAEEEAIYKERGQKMIQRVITNPGPLLNKAVKLRSEDALPPRYCISAEENILLCGKVDWLEYFADDDSVHIIDFKTGMNEENSDSLQLPIYALLVKNCQKRAIRKMSYWYLDKDDAPIEVPLPDFADAYERVMDIAIRVKATRQSRNFVCARNGCFACRPLENILAGKAKFIKTSGYQDIYIMSE